MLSEYMNWGTNRFLLNTTANAITSTIHRSGIHRMRPIPLRDFDRRLLSILVFKALVRWKMNQRGEAQSEQAGWLRRIALSGPGTECTGAGHAVGVRRDRRHARCAVRGAAGHADPLRWPGAIDRADRAVRLGIRCAVGPGEGRYAVTTERTAVFLNWRHIDAPPLLGRSFALACRDEGRLVGYVALRAPANTVPGHFIMTDLFYDDTSPEALPSLLNGAFDLAVTQSATVFEVFGFHPSLYRRLHEQRPYVLRRSELERIGRTASLRSLMTLFDRRWREAESVTYWYRPPNAELERICAAETWWPSGVDGDLNL